MTVLLLTHSRDTYVPDIVARAVEKRGVRPVRVDTDRLPREHMLTLTNERGYLDTGDDEVDLARVTGVWCRRLWPAALGVDVGPAYAQGAMAQAADHWFGAVAWLSARRVRVVNDPTAQQRAEHKGLQLHAARAAGLAMPPSLITNDPAAARAFVDEGAKGSGTVAKLLVPLSQTMDASGPFVYTSAVDARDARALDSLRHAPMIFQRTIEKAREVRAIVVGTEIHAGMFEVGARAPLDWRVPRTDHIAWKRAKLPPKVAAGARKLVKQLGLVTGALDFVVDREGTWWFLEVNPAGEWGWLERDLKLPIARAIAAQLVRKRGRS